MRQIAIGEIDDCFVLKEPKEWKSEIVKACTLEGEGIRVDVSTDAPSIHVYTGKWNNEYKDDRHGPFSGIAFEPVRYLNAINIPQWRDLVIFKPG